MIGTLFLSALAGVLSILSPCVLPLVPLVMGAALGEHRFGPLALAGGLAVSFTLAGVFLATVGAALGLDAQLVRMFGAGLLVAAGIVLAVPRLSNAMAVAAGPVSAWAGGLASDSRLGKGLQGQFLIGALLGLVWAPCVGPTLGAALSLSTQGGGVFGSVLVMASFGIGAGAALTAIGSLSRTWLKSSRTALGHWAEAGRQWLGWGLVLVGVMALSGIDKALETAILSVMPDWLVALTTSI